MMGPEEQRVSGWGGRCFVEPTRPWPNVATKRATGTTTPPSITPLLSRMLLEEVAPIQPIPAKLAHRQQPLLPRKLVFSPTPNGSALECYCPRRSQAKGVRDVMTDRCFAGYCGSWTPALRGEIYQRRSLGPIARSKDGTANGAKKGFGLGWLRRSGDDRTSPQPRSKWHCRTKLFPLACRELPIVPDRPRRYSLNLLEG